MPQQHFERLRGKAVLLTGASGFVGHHLAAFLLQQGIELTCPIRGHHLPAVISEKLSGANIVHVQSIDGGTDWSTHLSHIDCIVHCAARVHVMHETAADPIKLFRQINVEATLQLAQQAADAGVKRFVFLSSVKVNGEFTELGQPFTEQQTPHPQDAYAQSKYEAENGLRRIAEQSNMEVVIIRPPLIYGPGVAANFASLMRAAKKAIPLPLASIHNLRSFIYINNLTHFIAHCMQHPQAANQTFLISDGTDMSTPGLLIRAAAAFGKKARLLPCPAGLLTSLAFLLGKKAAVDRLTQCLQVDIGKATQLLQWSAPYTVEQGLLATAIAMNANDDLPHAQKII